MTAHERDVLNAMSEDLIDLASLPNDKGERLSRAGKIIALQMAADALRSLYIREGRIKELELVDAACVAGRECMHDAAERRREGIAEPVGES